jgi:hypothetical protein
LAAGELRPNRPSGPAAGEIWYSKADAAVPYFDRRIPNENAKISLFSNVPGGAIISMAGTWYDLSARMLREQGNRRPHLRQNRFEPAGQPQALRDDLVFETEPPANIYDGWQVC